jgi:hypothetical protein
MTTTDLETVDLVIPKSTVDAEIRDSRGRVRVVQFFLATEGEQHRERLQDVLNARHFLPIRVVRLLGLDQTGVRTGFELLNRDHVIWVRLDIFTAIDELDLEAEGADGSVSARVRLLLDDGSDLEGGLRYLLPSESRRVGDYLETLPPYFPVRTQDHLYLVRRDRVVAVTPLDEVKK